MKYSTKTSIDIYFVGMWPDYEEAFLHNARLPGVNIGVVNLRRKKSRLSPNLLPKSVRFTQLKHRLNKLFSQNPKAIFIFQDNDRLLRLLSEYHFRNTIHLLLRNTVSTKPQLISNLPGLIKTYPIWSFDHQDCRRYGLHYYRQFIAPVEVTPGSDNTDLLFVGKNKNRSRTLSRINSLCSEAGLIFECIIVDKERIPYSRYIEKVLSTKCVVDVVQEGQTGLTLRPLEAMIYNKKLLTNSVEICKCWMNSGNWILSDNIGDIKAERLSEFLEKPAKFPSSEIIERYRVERLIENVLGYQRRGPD